MKGFLLSIFVISAVFATAYSIKCYVCSGTEDHCSKSNLEGDTKYQEDCSAAADQCIRVWAKDKDGKKSVGNTCGNDAACTLAKGICNAAEDQDSDVECEVGCCKSDLCNAGSSASFSVFLMTVCSVLGLALLK